MARKFTLFHKRKSKAKRSLWASLLLLLVLSGWQYIEMGRITWHLAALDEIQNSAHQLIRTWQGIEDNNELPPRGQQLSGRVVKVTDGDTLTLRTADWYDYTIRLHGIDAPESDQPYGDRATNALSRMVNRQHVTVMIEDIDRYKRLVGTIVSEGININLAMVHDGHAWWYQQYAKSVRTLADAEASAREDRAGLWADSNPVPPWQWRQRR